MNYQILHKQVYSAITIIQLIQNKTILSNEPSAGIESNFQYMMFYFTLNISNN